MDSTLLDQVRHLCRDRAAYEHLKAILVQQERVHQISWEECYDKLMAAQSSDTQADIFSNIIAREKSLAQLAETIQRSPSLELVLQIAVQVAQKLLKVDRVAIFRGYPDGRGEFATDAIASGVTSLADMPERQLSLARHMIESTAPENSAQTIDSIRTSSMSSHIVTLFEQIGISSYAANKIYAGQDVWGTLVAFHGGAYHIWSESDRTSLSLIAAQIGIAISLTNLRQQSQDLTDDLQTLQIELDDLQRTVTEIAAEETKSTDQQIDNLLSKNIEPDDLEVTQNEKDTDSERSELETIVNNEEAIPDEPAINFTRADISYVIMPDNLKVISDIASEPEESVDLESQESEQEIITSELVETEFASCVSEELEPVALIEAVHLDETQVIETELVTPELVVPESVEEVIAPEINEPEVELMDGSQIGIDTTIDFAHDNEEQDEEPAIEPQFIETILDTAGNNVKATDYLLSVIDSYLEETPQLVQAIDKGLAVDDRARILQSLNTLRSSSEYVGALTLSYQCRQLELAIRANYVVLIYACLSQVAIEAQRATDALRILRSRYAL
jgi:GAF domain-containing protein/HPt (histidine-containing phosphotransfer) domain-containing protein